MHCLACDQEIASTDSFCSNCGRPMALATRAAPIHPGPAPEHRPADPPSVPPVVEGMPDHPTIRPRRRSRATWLVAGVAVLALGGGGGTYVLIDRAEGRDPAGSAA